MTFLSLALAAGINAYPPQHFVDGCISRRDVKIVQKQIQLDYYIAKSSESEVIGLVAREKAGRPDSLSNSRDAQTAAVEHLHLEKTFLH